MSNVTATFSAPSQGAANQAQISWVRNGVAAAVVIVPMSGSGPFSADFNSGNPGVTLAPGDVISCTGQAMDTVDNLVGPVDNPTPASVTIPAVVPPAPSDLQNFSLALS